ncbi:probable alcohol acetyltransferase [Diutina catenulata]
MFRRAWVPYRTFANYLGDSLSKEIPAVDLAFDKLAPPNVDTPVHSPLVVLHGLFGSKANSRTVAKSLAERLSRNVYTLDLRNFGSSPHVERLDYPSLAMDVEQWCQRHLSDEPGKPILIGHSMGAKTVMVVALRSPDLPKGIVSVDNAPVNLGPPSSGSAFPRYINQLRLATEKYGYTNIKDVDAKLAEVEPNKTVRQFLLMNMNRGKKNDPITSKIPLDIIGNAVTKGMIASWPYDFQKSRWTGPALFVRGTESQYVPDEVIADIGQFFPHFELRDIKAGHWVISEKPEEFMDVVSDWVERLEDEEMLL